MIWIIIRPSFFASFVLWRMFFFTAGKALKVVEVKMSLAYSNCKVSHLSKDSSEFRHHVLVLFSNVTGVHRPEKYSFCFNTQLFLQ